MEKAAVNRQPDLDRRLALLERKGKELYGEHFKLYQEDHPLLEKLMAYMVEDREKVEQMGLSLRKGILLLGPTGCGKTSLMTLLRLFRPPDECYRVKSCRVVSFEFHKEGYEVIRCYSQGILWSPSRKPGAYCFDDLGAESCLKHYGNTCNVMGEILLSRYDLFVSQGVKTHLTTNLTSSEIEKTYGSRVRSRMREMFNLVSFEKGARDKRG
ncbi:ATPase [Pontibacter qinzhouensis]|uniref:ATPase n=1 Tax=Pontibacter qinzhouensis TaxID=2603253 RepID=A0A5C8K9F2_9BACT|nr:ATPase [Pontibacter qinzhouensis]TXK45719.1 ATPase [Pontibacter qinzhouensis]